MRSEIDYTLKLRSTSIGSWSFRGDLVDSSPNAKTLTGENIVLTDYQSGYSEDEVTALTLDGINKRASLNSASATVYDMGMNSFSVEVIAHFVSPVAFGQLVKKYEPTNEQGWFLEIDTGGKLTAGVGDGAITAIKVTSAQVIADGKWHYCAMVVDRTAQTLTLYVDGVSIGSASLATLVGLIEAPTEGLLIGNLIAGTVDEVSISLEALSAAEVSFRNAGESVSVQEFEPDFMMRHLPRINHGNKELSDFLLPFNVQFSNMRQSAKELRDLMKFDQTPDKFLSHLVTLFDFELLDEKFLDRASRREFMRWIMWIYKRKGTATALVKIAELLGFTLTIAETLAPVSPFISGRHRTWRRDLIADDLFAEDFQSGSLAIFKRMNLGAWWRLENNKLRGTGDGTISPENAMTFVETSSVFYMEVEFEVTAGATGDNEDLGMYLAYQDSNNWVRLIFMKSFFTRVYAIEKNVGGTITQSLPISILNSPDFLTGVHKVIVHADLTTGTFTVGIDETIVYYKRVFDVSAISPLRKGFFVSRSMTVDFSDVKIQSLNNNWMAKTFENPLALRNVNLTLAGSPANSQSRSDYLKEITPDYMPIGTNITWM